MPAKKKYLSGAGERASKVTAAILLGYVLAMLLHITLAKHAPDDTPVLMTSAYSSFLTWVGLMILAFFMPKARHVWTLYTGLSLLCVALLI